MDIESDNKNENINQDIQPSNDNYQRVLNYFLGYESDEGDNNTPQPAFLENNGYEKISKYFQYNFCCSYQNKDNEYIKKKVIDYLRGVNKFKCKTCYKYNQNYKSFLDQNKIQNHYYLLRKRKPLNSQDDVQISNMVLEKDNLSYYFPKYADFVVGFCNFYKRDRQILNVNNDSMSDENILEISRKFCLYDLDSGIKCAEKGAIDEINNRIQEKLDRYQQNINKNK